MMKDAIIRGSGPLALAAAALVAVACADSPPPSAPDLALEGPASQLAEQPVELEYLKVETGNQTGAWTGRIWGDVLPTPVGLETRVFDLRVAGPVWHIKTYWTVHGGTRAFRAELVGTLNTATGDLTLNGTVVSGIFAGSRVHNEGRLTQVLGSGATAFEGNMWIMPASAP